MLLEDVNTLMETNIENDGIDTIGSWILSQKIEVKLNEVPVYNEFEFIVKKRMVYIFKPLGSQSTTFFEL